MRRSLLLFCLVTVLSVPAFAGSILWDVSHGIYFDYYPGGRYSQMVSHLGSLGYPVTTTTSGFLVDDPAGYSAIVIAVGSSWDTEYSAAEVDVIKNYVNAGGGLLLMADNPSTMLFDILPVAQAFGFDIGTSEVVPYDTYTSDLTPDPIFDGVTSIYMRAAGGISGGTVVARQEITLTPLVSVTTYGSGRVILMGDNNSFDDAYRGQVDNIKWEENSIEWLTGSTQVPEPASLLFLGTGLGVIGLAAWRKRK
jgi:hypothetical protein